MADLPETKISDVMTVLEAKEATIKALEAKLDAREKILEARNSPVVQMAPVVATIIAALIALGSSFLGAWLQTQAVNKQIDSAQTQAEKRHVDDLDTEQKKLEADLVVKALNTDDPNQALKRLRFYVQVGYVSDSKGTIKGLKTADLPLEINAPPPQVFVGSAQSLPAPNIARLLKTFQQLRVQGTQWQLGAKAYPLSTDPSNVQRLDSSGFVRYLLAYSTDGQLVLPDGSQQQAS